MLSRASKGNLGLISGASRGFFLFIIAHFPPEKCTTVKIWTLFQHLSNLCARSAQGLLFGTILDRCRKEYDC